MAFIVEQLEDEIHWASLWMDKALLSQMMEVSTDTSPRIVGSRDHQTRHSSVSVSRLDSGGTSGLEC